MSLHIYLGPMFAGKTSVLQSIHRRWKSLGFICVAYKPQMDTRYSKESITSHDQIHTSATTVTHLMECLKTEEYKSANLILIEEAQFFTDLFEFVMLSVEENKKQVVVAGLDGDKYRMPFGQILNLIPYADRIQKLTAFCRLCGDGTPALFSFCSSKKQDQILVGASENYQAVCRKHYLFLEKVFTEDSNESLETK